jgi:hypothetical protein
LFHVGLIPSYPRASMTSVAYRMDCICLIGIYVFGLRHPFWLYLKNKVSTSVWTAQKLTKSGRRGVGKGHASHILFNQIDYVLDDVSQTLVLPKRGSSLVIKDELAILHKGNPRSCSHLHSPGFNNVQHKAALFEEMTRAFFVTRQFVPSKNSYYEACNTSSLIATLELLWQTVLWDDKIPVNTKTVLVVTNNLSYHRVAGKTWTFSRNHEVFCERFRATL